MLTTPRPDARLVERLSRKIRSPDVSAAAWIAGGEALALALVGSVPDGDLEVWAADLADTMVGALLRVLERSVNEATVEERVRLSVAAAVLSVARPHCTSVLDGAVDAWLYWTPERAGAHHGEQALTSWILLALLRDDHDAIAHTSWCLARADRSGLGMILHDWAVARIQGHGPAREVQCFHALRAAIGCLDEPRPGLLLLAAAVAVTAGHEKRRRVHPWLHEIARELREHGTARATPLAVGRR